MEVFFTVVTGFATFALGQIAVKLVIDPVQEFKKVVADISHAVIEYANVYSNPGIPSLEVQKKVSEDTRKLSSRLNAQMYLVPCYSVTAVLFGLPRKARVVEAAGYLICLSNSVFGSAKNQAIANAEKSEKLCDALGIYVHEGDRISPKKKNNA